ncbi:MAG: class I SAM-dependent methyltransferase [Candidatus Shapirobacteria bacterium]|nr:class I SAM-dependent methyltransferase [Candidatus Shapirobacteria bacterium]
MKQKVQFNEQRYRLAFLGSGDQERVKIILNLIGSNKKVLDVGCGRGEIGYLLKQKNNQVFGVDISPGAVRAARRAGVAAKTIDLEEAKIPFQQKFDVVLAGEIIEHIFDTESFLKKLSGALKDGGDLIITTPNLASLGRRLLLLVGQNPLVETDINPDLNRAGHIRYFVKKTLFTILAKNGFRIVNFYSDIVNFCPSGKINSRFLAKIFPSLGKTLIVWATKT